jgi:hypothetical protein
MYCVGVVVSKCRDACRCNTSLAERICLQRCSMSGTIVTPIQKPNQAEPFSLLQHNPDLDGASPFCHARPIPGIGWENWLAVIQSRCVKVYHRPRSRGRRATPINGSFSSFYGCHPDVIKPCLLIVRRRRPCHHRCKQRLSRISIRQSASHKAKADIGE